MYYVWEGAIFYWGEGASHCKVWGHSTVICAKTAEPIEMPFGLWVQMSQRNHKLDEIQIFLWEEAILGEMDAHCKV